MVWHLSTLNDVCQSFSYLIKAYRSFCMFWQSTGIFILRYWNSHLQTISLLMKYKKASHKCKSGTAKALI